MIIVDNDSIAVVVASSRCRVMYTAEEMLVVKFRNTLGLGFIISTNPENSVRELVVISLGNKPVYIKVEVELGVHMETIMSNITTCMHGNSEWDKHFGYLLLADLKKNKTSLVNFFKRKEVAEIGLRYKLFNRLELIEILKTKTEKDINLVIKTV